MILSYVLGALFLELVWAVLAKKRARPRENEVNDVAKSRHLLPPMRCGRETQQAQQCSSERISNGLPHDKDDSLLTGDEVSPTGFRVHEIRQMGDFPDYAGLSGVPLPTPYKTFDINKALPRPYRPFRWLFHQTMAYFKLEPDWWLELESSYVERIAQRKRIYAQYGSTVLQHRPGSEMACKELLEMVIQFLCARYPRYFSLSGDQTILHNRILHTSTNIKTTPPMLVLLENVPEEFVIMLRNPEDGEYYCKAGVMLSALGFSLGEKIDKPLGEIHAGVPDYKSKMEFSMDRFFAKLPTDKPIQRGSWDFVGGQPLFIAPGSPAEAERDVRDPNLTVSSCHLRVDWQTLRRLPLTGAVVFNFKAIFTPLEELRENPYIPALALEVLNEGNEEILRYKKISTTEHVVKPALKQWKREQEARGMVEPGWQPRTLDEAPHYPGWKQRWQAAQAFSPPGMNE